MKTKVSPTIVGLFVLGALALALGALFSFGGVSFFSKPERFVVYFNESIHGLDNGSPVKLRGVRIGRVVSMNVRAIPSSPGSGDARSVVAVVCELSRDVVADGQGHPVDVSDREELQRLIDKGLRAQLGIIGLATGLLFVELDFYDPAKYPAKSRFGVESAYLEMPAVASAISEFQANLTSVLNDIRRINFKQLADNVQDLLNEARSKVKAADLAAVTREWAEAGKAVRARVESPEVSALLTSVASASARLDHVLADLEKATGPGAEQFTQVMLEARATLMEISEMSAVMKQFIHAQQYLGDDASKALVQLGQAAAAVARLADFLERNPSALLSGRPSDNN